MSVAGHLESLRHKHLELEAAIHEEYTHAYPNLERLKSLKVQKLKVKEELAHTTFPKQAANNNLRPKPAP